MQYIFRACLLILMFAFAYWPYAEQAKADEQILLADNSGHEEEIDDVLDDLFGEKKEPEEIKPEEAPAQVEEKSEEVAEPAKETSTKGRIILPSTIYKKRYNNENKHLPKAVYAEDLNKYLFAAAANDNINGLRALIDAGRDPNVKNALGNTPLMAAAYAGSINATRLLLVKGAKPDAQNNNGLTALHVAAHKGNNSIVKTLINAGAKADIKDKEGNTPLMAASAAGEIISAKMLIDNGVDVDSQNAMGLSALHIAAYKGRTNIVYLLLKANVDPSLRTKQDLTAEELAISGRHPLTARALQGAAPRREAKTNSDYILSQLSNDEEREATWYSKAAHLTHYEFLPLTDQKLWDKMLASWMVADEKFDQLSEVEKKQWKEKLGILKIVFRDYFTADTIENQMLLDRYMKKWELDINDTEAKQEQESEQENEESAQEEVEKPKIDEEQERLVKELQEIEENIPSDEDFDKVKSEYKEKFGDEEEGLPIDLPDLISEDNAEVSDSEETVIEQNQEAAPVQEQEGPMESEQEMEEPVSDAEPILDELKIEEENSSSQGGEDADVSLEQDEGHTDVIDENIIAAAVVEEHSVEQENVQQENIDTSSTISVDEKNNQILEDEIWEGELSSEDEAQEISE